MKRILIANRGEIAIRISRAARALDLIPLGIASEADRHALHRRSMDESRIIGQGPARESYLNIERILSAAKAMHADAVHPGYGFLSERADFAQAVLDAGLIFVGPQPATLHAAGDKRVARRLAAAAGIPTLLGYDGDDQRLETLLHEAQRIGFPILIKASNGGGGRGQRVVRESADFAEALAAAQREALAAFGDDSVLLERYVLQPRHIEFQIVADHHGRIVHLGERDCSLQRRRQKVIEEAPAPGLTADARSAMASAAIAIARAAEYRNLGTVEFLVAPDGAFYFLEMNARLQVEHPVTESISGVDLVQTQFRIARGEPLPPELGERRPVGWSLEARICAEDPLHDLLPSSGIIRTWKMPTGAHVRVDSGYDVGSVVPVDYDSLLAKLIVWGPTRTAALLELQTALQRTEIRGVATNLALLQLLADDAAVRSGTMSTTMIDDGGYLRELKTLAKPPSLTDEELALAVAARLAADSSWRVDDVGRIFLLTIDGLLTPVRLSRIGNAWRIAALPADLLSDPIPPDASTLQLHYSLGTPSATAVHLSVTYARDGAVEHEITAVLRPDGSDVAIARDGRSTELRCGVLPAPSTVQRFTRRANAGSGPAETLISSPMPGRLVKLLVTTGETVADHQLLAILEAMKMEHRIEAPAPGRIGELFAVEGDVIAAQAPLLELLPPEATP